MNECLDFNDLHRLEGYTIYDLYESATLKIIYANENEVRFDDDTFVGDDPVFDRDRYIPIADENGCSLLVIEYTRLDEKLVKIYSYQNKDILYMLIDNDELTFFKTNELSDVIERLLEEIDIYHALYIDRKSAWNETIELILVSWERSNYKHKRAEAFEKLRCCL